jgi:DNA replication protein DnaC
MNPQTLAQQFNLLRLPTAAIELESVLNEEKSAASLGWVIKLMERELDARRERMLQNRIKAARFPETPSLEAFDWKFNPDIDEQKIRELANLSFIPECQIALMLGKPGTGKTHLSLAIGVLAVHRGYRVYCTTIKELAEEIIIAKMKGELDRLFKRMLSSQLWILDDWGLINMKREVAEEVFDLLDRRRHSSAMILTSNRDVDEWPSMFPEPVLASASLDRICDRAEKIFFVGESYRLKGKIKPRDVKI